MTSPVATAANNQANGLAFPNVPAITEGRPNTPLPMMQLIVSAARLQRPIARTSVGLRHWWFVSQVEGKGLSQPSATTLSEWIFAIKQIHLRKNLTPENSSRIIRPISNATSTFSAFLIRNWFLSKRLGQSISCLARDVRNQTDRQVRKTHVNQKCWCYEFRSFSSRLCPLQATVGRTT